MSFLYPQILISFSKTQAGHFHIRKCPVFRSIKLWFIALIRNLSRFSITFVVISTSKLYLLINLFRVNSYIHFLSHLTFVKSSLFLIELFLQFFMKCTYLFSTFLMRWRTFLYHCIYKELLIEEYI